MEDALQAIEEETYDDEDRKVGRFIRTSWIMWITIIANMIKPEMFFLSQFLSGGESDLMDFEPIYMEPLEASLYFLVASIILPWMQLNSFVFVTFFWYLYAAEMFYMVVKMFMKIFIQ